MKKKNELSRAISWIGLITLSVLSIPFVAMQFTNEVDWRFLDFSIMGVLIFGICISFYLITRSSKNFIFRLAVGISIFTTFLLIWVNLAVGLIGSGPNIANLMYIGILFILVIGAYLSHFRPKGMERVMFISAITVLLFAAIQLLAKMYKYPGSSVIEIMAVNGFFAMLFFYSALLFRMTSRKKDLAPKKSSIPFKF